MPATFRSRALVLGAATLAFATLGCHGKGAHGGGPTDSDGGGTSGLAIQPIDPVLAVNGMTPASVDFQVLRDGMDVTSQAKFVVDNGNLGSFSGGTFASQPGAAGKTMVRARLDGEEVATSISIKLTSVVIGNGAPPDAPSKFSGSTDPNLAPEVAYPPAGALIPPNLNMLEVQWDPKSFADGLFEVSFSSDALDLKIYTACTAAGTGCGLLPDESTWKLLSGASRGGSVMIGLRGTGKSGGPVGVAPPRQLSFGDDDILGGLYYWAASSGGVYRYDFGRRGQKAESFYDPPHAGAICVGCHALSRNGKTIAVGLNIPAPSVMRALDVATRKPLFNDLGGGFPGTGGSDFEALSPDGATLITTEGDGLSVRKAATGALIGKSPALPNADMPDLSADGKWVVFARGAGMCPPGACSLSLSGAGLYTAAFTGTSFGAPKQIVAGGTTNNYYPSFSPDGAFVVFNRAAGDSYDAPDAKLMVVSSTGGKPIELSAANLEPGNSWPKFGPFVQHYKGATIFWITFSSRRPYGLLQPMDAGKPGSQLWMVPVDAAKLQAGSDPGYPPIWMPFQDIATGNHIAQWVEKVERAPCSQIDQSGCMMGEVCVNGTCEPGIQ